MKKFRSIKNLQNVLRASPLGKSKFGSSKFGKKIGVNDRRIGVSDRRKTASKVIDTSGTTNLSFFSGSNGVKGSRIIKYHEKGIDVVSPDVKKNIDKRKDRGRSFTNKHLTGFKGVGNEFIKNLGSKSGVYPAYELKTDRRKPAKKKKKQ